MLRDEAIKLTARIHIVIPLSEVQICRLCQSNEIWNIFCGKNIQHFGTYSQQVYDYRPSSYGLLFTNVSRTVLCVNFTYAYSSKQQLWCLNGFGAACTAYACMHSRSRPPLREGPRLRFPLPYSMLLLHFLSSTSKHQMCKSIPSFYLPSICSFPPFLCLFPAAKHSTWAYYYPSLVATLRAARRFPALASRTKNTSLL